MIETPVKTPTIALVGWGRVGKDTIGEMIGDRTKLRYTGSLSWYGLDYMAERLGVCKQLAWERRHLHRELWKKWLDEFREDNHCRLIEMALAAGEIVVGIRDVRELVAAREKNLLDYVVWIKRDGIPCDPTVTFDESYADVIFDNSGDLDQLSYDVDSTLIGGLSLPKKPNLTREFHK